MENKSYKTNYYKAPHKNGPKLLPPAGNVPKRLTVWSRCKAMLKRCQILVT